MIGRWLRVSFCALVAATSMLLTDPLSAQAQTTGAESFRGFLVSSGISGNREVLASEVRATGVFAGVGRIVERENLPGDSDDVSRDDLVFAAGTLRIVNINVGFSFDINPVTCILHVTVQQITTVDGGTGQFAHASGSFSGSVVATALATRNPDKSCSQEQLPRHELDRVAAIGTLSL